MSYNKSEENSPTMEQKVFLFSSNEGSPDSSLDTTPDISDAEDHRNVETLIENICFVGAGYVGGPTAAVLALQNPNIRVHVVDKDSQRIGRWNSKHLPVHEPGLDSVVRIARDGLKRTHFVDGSIEVPERSPNLFFSTDVERSVAQADIVFISVNTPTKSCGIGAGSATNMAAFESAVISTAKHMKPGAILVEKSTVPCGTSQTIQDILALYRPNETFEVLSNPEFLAEGSAIPDLCNPDRILIGSAPTASGRAAANVLRNVYSSWVDPSKILTVNVWSSELAKLVANAMLAQRISSINTISAICDQTGADVDEIARAVGLDSRLGAKFLRAGIGFGGSCFKKDILSLIYLARSLHLPEVGNYWESVLAVNEFQMDRFTRRVVSKLHGALTGKKIAVLGFTFKENTNDTRESPSINVIKAVLSERPSEIAIFDPGCTALEVKELISLETSTTTDRALKPDGPIEAYANAYEACRNSSAVLIMTPWSQFYYPQSNLQTATRAPLDLIRTENAQGPRSDTEGLTNWTDRLVSESECAENCILCLEAAKPSYSEAHKNVDWGLIASSMQEPKWVFDGRNIVDKKAMATLGFRVESLGKSRV